MDIKVTSVEAFIQEARDHQASIDVSAFPEMPAERVQLARLSITHDAIMDWLLANPHKGQMRDCALHFGFTRAWLSSVVWSDAFQAKLRDKKDFLFAETLVPLRDQINGIAQRTLERLGEKVEVIEDPVKLLDVADKMLHRLGYAPRVDQKPAGVVQNQQNNYYAVSPTLLAEARESAKKGDLIYEQPQAALPLTPGIQADGGSLLGEMADGAASLYSEENEGEETWREMAGDQV